MVGILPRLLRQVQRVGFIVRCRCAAEMAEGAYPRRWGRND
jgi:hypothetical protein